MRSVMLQINEYDDDDDDNQVTEDQGATVSRIINCSTKPFA